ncbi:MAG: glycine cleavage system protein H [Ignavibacteria bacterium]|nr:glycine cleavage system protein H [Ignavibacteria bacterium]
MVALAVILFAITLLTIDLVIQARQKKYPLMSPSLRSSEKADVVRMPKSVFFHPAHTWARMEGADSVTVGLDDFIQKAVGAIDKVYLPMIGQKVKQGDPVITVHHGDRKLMLVAPISGTVFALNNDVLDNPALIAANPYEEGWLFRLEPELLANSLSLLTIAENAVSWIRTEAMRFREFLAGQTLQHATLGATMLDGGVPVANSLEYLDDSSLRKFEDQFLR